MTDVKIPVLEPEKLFPDEPTRFTPKELDRLLVYCQKLNASDITLQTGQVVFAEVYGRLLHMTHRKLSNTEVGDMLNAIYGPNGTAQILSGHDIDTHYEVKPTRIERYRYRVNGTGCLIGGHDRSEEHTSELQSQFHLVCRL